MNTNTAAPETKKKSRPFRTLAIIACWSIVAAVVFVSWPTPPQQQMPEKNSQGEFMENLLKQKDNAFFDYLNACRYLNHDRLYAKTDEAKQLDKEIYELIKDFSVNAPINSEIRAYSQDNKVATDLARQALKKGMWQAPKITGLADGLAYLAPFRELGRLMVLEGKILEQDGNNSAAIDRYIDTLKFSHDLPSGGGIIHTLVSYTIDEHALKAISGLCPRLSADQLASLIERLDGAYSYDYVLTDIIGTEIELFGRQYLDYCVASRGNITGFKDIDTDSDGNFPRLDHYIANYTVYVNRNIAWVKLKYQYDDIMKNMGNIETKSREYFSAAPGSEDEKRIADQIFGPQGLEKKFLAVWPPNTCESPSTFSSISAFKTEMERDWLNWNAAKLRAALELYKKQTGEYPATLQVLADKGIVSELDINDPYSGYSWDYDQGDLCSVSQNKKLNQKF